MTTVPALMDTIAVLRRDLAEAEARYQRSSALNERMCYEVHNLKAEVERLRGLLTEARSDLSQWETYVVGAAPRKDPLLPRIDAALTASPACSGAKQAEGDVPEPEKVSIAATWVVGPDVAPPADPRRWAYDDPATGQTYYRDSPINCAGAYEVGPPDSDPRQKPVPKPPSENDEQLREMVDDGTAGQARNERSDPRLEAMEALWQDVAGATPETEDERLRYVSVQIDRKTWLEVQRIAALDTAREHSDGAEDVGAEKFPNGKEPRDAR